MRKVVLSSILALGVLGPASAQEAQPDAAAETTPAAGDAAQISVWDGVYTEEQATRGADPYSDACAVCHGNAARGGPDAPGLIGTPFNRRWADKSVAEYYEFVHTMMPFGRPNSLPAQTYIDIIAFIFNKHGFPTGETELPNDEEALAQIIIVPEQQ